MVKGSIGKKWVVKEAFSGKKLLKAFKLTSGVEWTKDIVSLFNIRKLIIYTIVLSLLGGYAYYKGKQNLPIQVDVEYGKEVIIELEANRQLYVSQDGYVYLRDKKGNNIKQILVKDIPGLKSKLSGIGLQLKPILIIGAGSDIDGNISPEIGLGISFLRTWKLEWEAFVTSKGIYLGSSYQITDSSGLGVGLGKGWSNDWRGVIYWKFKF